VILELGEDPVHHVAAGQAGLPPGEARRYPCQQVLQQSRVRGIIYAAISGCCAIALSHKLA
jgi:hypothetical protein